QRRRRRLLAGSEEVSTSSDQIVLLQKRVRAHSLLVGVHEIGRLCVLVIRFHGTRHIANDILVVLQMVSGVLLNSVVADVGNVLDRWKENGEWEQLARRDVIDHLQKALDVVYQIISAIVLVPIPEEHLVDDVSDHELNRPPHVDAVLVFDALQVSKILRYRIAHQFLHHILAH
ncbi:hypothetical protein PMAYCL1PPCAC_15027, partial [Pristionchus mayeri]